MVVRVANRPRTIRQPMFCILLRERPMVAGLMMGAAVFLMIGTFDALWAIVLDDLDELAVRREPADAHTGRLQLGHELLVDLVAVAVPLGDLACAVGLVGERFGLEQRLVRPEPHRSAQLLHAQQVAQLVDHAVLGRLVELGRVIQLGLFFIEFIFHLLEGALLPVNGGFGVLNFRGMVKIKVSIVSIIEFQCVL